MSDKHYLFDVDGTLTKHRQKMSAPFYDEFLQWMEGRSVFLVAGSDLEKVEEQVPVEIINNCKGIFCSMANELWIKGRLVHRNNWTPTADFLSYLSQLYQSSHFTPKGKNFIEKRTGMVNFSIVGREAPRELRGIYNEWDKKNKEREDMARTIMLDYPDLQACLGGQISIDIQPKGRNKAQASKWVREELGGTAIYFGDNCEIGGNDYDVCVDITENGGIVHKVESPDETLSILNNEN